MEQPRATTGIEVAVVWHGQTVSSRWFLRTKEVAVGDSALWPLLFPLRNTPKKAWPFSEQPKVPLKREGFQVRNSNSAASFGATLFRNKRGHWRLFLPEGSEAVLANGSRLQRKKGGHRLQQGVQGEIQGATGWLLRFSVQKQKRAVIPRESVVSPFFLQALVWAMVFLGGLLWIAFVSRRPPMILRDLPAMVKRVAMFHSSRAKEIKEKEKHKPPPPPQPKRRPLLRSALAARKIRFRTQRVKSIRKVKMAAFFKSQRSHIRKMRHDEPLELDNLEGEEREATQTTAALPPTDPVELTPVTSPITPVAVPPLPQKHPSRPKPFVKVRPKRLTFPGLPYPESAKHLGIEGKVQMRLYIDATGKVVRVVLLKRLHPILNKAAERAALKATYQPAKDQYGNPIASTTVISVRFELEEDDEE